MPILQRFFTKDRTPKCERSLKRVLKGGHSVRDQVVERGKPADYGQEIVKRRSRITASLLPLQDKTILDFGAGNGAQTMELLNHGCSVVACDIDAGDLAVLDEFVKAQHITTVRTVSYDGTRLPFSDEQFDAVVCYQVLEHVGDEAVALGEIHRVLKPGCSFVISVPHKWWVFETHGARLPLLPWNRVPFFSWLPKPIHARYAKARIYRKRDIAHLLQAHGFQVLGTAYMTAPMDMARPEIIQRLLRRVVFRNDQTRLPLLATEIFVHARKP